MKKEINAVATFNENGELIVQSECKNAEVAYEVYKNLIDTFNSLKGDKRIPKTVRTIARLRQMIGDDKLRIMSIEKIEFGAKEC